MDRLWRYYGPGQFTWGTAEPRDYSFPEMSDEEEVDGQVAETTQDCQPVFSASPEMELCGNELPADENPVQQDIIGRARPRRQARRPRRLDDFYLED